MTEPSAAKITVGETLAYFDGGFKSLAADVANGECVLWIGSGISFGRASGLWEVVEKVLEYLRVHVDRNNPACPYTRGLDEALAMTGLDAGSLISIDWDLSVADWPSRDAVVKPLVSQYSRLLDIPIPGQAADLLLWDAADVRGTFSTVVDPDCEHLCLALLGLEGAAPEIVTANWDGLIENAVDEFVEDRNAALAVGVRDEDIRQNFREIRLLKFHGCAVLAAEDPDQYRKYLVARSTQITNYAASERESPLMKVELRTLVATRPTLMIGLSAQDVDVRQIFAKANDLMSWTWTPDARAYVFAGSELNPDQREILKLAFEGQYQNEGVAIEESALVPAYAKQLLTALYLHVLAAKLTAYVRLCPGAVFDDQAFADLQTGMLHLRDRIASVSEPDYLRFIRNFLRAYARAESTFRSGQDSGAVQPRYKALSGYPVSRVSTDPNLASNGVPEACTALGLLGHGDRIGTWDITTGATQQGTHGTVLASALGRERAVFVVASSDAAIRLRIDGLVSDDVNDAIIVYSKARPPRSSRSPAGKLGRTNVAEVSEVSMSELVTTTTSAAELFQAFREEASL